MLKLAKLTVFSYSYSPPPKDVTKFPSNLTLDIPESLSLIFALIVKVSDSPLLRVAELGVTVILLITGSAVSLLLIVIVLLELL